MLKRKRSPYLMTQTAQSQILKMMLIKTPPMTLLPKLIILKLLMVPKQMLKLLRIKVS